MRLGEDDEALANFRALQSAYQRIGDWRNLATVLYRMSDILLNRGLLDQAEPLLTQALELALQYAPGHPGINLLKELVSSLNGKTEGG